MCYNAPMNFYQTAETALLSPEIDTKERLCAELLRYCSTNETFDQAGHSPLLFDTPSYAAFCTIVSPRELPARKHFDTTEGLATLVHAITHIEFSAIDLALDAVYRFPQMPQPYKMDWLGVAEDEIRHFRMLQAILGELGCAYGDLPVHQGLFDASMHTAGDVLDRMAVIPRHYEAGGLDVNPQIVKKLRNQAKSPLIVRIIEVLDVIESEEIDHVRKGDFWFRWLCAQRGLEPTETFREILDRYALHRHKPHMNIQARKAAGFACEELLSLGAKACR